MLEVVVIILCVCVLGMLLLSSFLLIWGSFCICYWVGVGVFLANKDTKQAVPSVKCTVIFQRKPFSRKMLEKGQS